MCLERVEMVFRVKLPEGGFGAAIGVLTDKSLPALMATIIEPKQQFLEAECGENM